MTNWNGLTWDELPNDTPKVDSPERIKEIEAYEAYENYNSEMEDIPE